MDYLFEKLKIFRNTYLHFVENKGLTYLPTFFIIVPLIVDCSFNCRLFLLALFRSMC